MKLVTQESSVAVSTVGTVQPSSTLAVQLLRVAIVSVVVESLKRENLLSSSNLARDGCF